MDGFDIALRLVGAFYVFAGYVATRAALTSHFLDRAIAAIAAKRPTRTETAQFVWLLAAAALVGAGGIALMLQLDIAMWLFLASALGQATYLFLLAPRIFDVDDPPGPQGRRQSTNAFVIYLAATAFVLWAAHKGRLLGWHEVAWPLLALAAAAVAAYAAWVASLLGKAPARTPLFGGAADSDTSLLPSQTQRVKVMADYGSPPLWALDGAYSAFPPEEFGLSDELAGDLNAWAEAYTASFDRDDPITSLWSDEQRSAHDAAGRSLAIRLARERPDVMVYVLDGATGVVQVHAHDMT